MSRWAAKRESESQSGEGEEPLPNRRGSIVALISSREGQRSECILDASCTRGVPWMQRCRNTHGRRMKKCRARGDRTEPWATAWARVGGRANDVEDKMLSGLLCCQLPSGIPYRETLSDI